MIGKCSSLLSIAMVHHASPLSGTPSRVRLTGHWSKLVIDVLCLGGHRIRQDHWLKGAEAHSSEAARLLNGCWCA